MTGGLVDKPAPGPPPLRAQALRLAHHGGRARGCTLRTTIIPATFTRPHRCLPRRRPPCSRRPHGLPLLSPLRPPYVQVLPFGQTWDLSRPTPPRAPAPLSPLRPGLSAAPSAPPRPRRGPDEPAWLPQKFWGHALTLRSHDLGPPPPSATPSGASTSLPGGTAPLPAAHSAFSRAVASAALRPASAAATPKRRRLSLEELDKFAALAASHARADATHASIDTALKRFLDFLHAYGIHIGTSGISDVDLARYVYFLAAEDTISSALTINTYLSNGPSYWHRQHGLPYPEYTSRPRVAEAIRACKKLLKATTGTRRKQAITVIILRDIRAFLDLSRPADRFFWAAATIAFYCLLRKANVCIPRRAADGGPRAPTAAAHAKLQAEVLTRSAVSRDAADNLWLSLRHTKTIQLGERTLRLPVPSIPAAPELCPRLALLAHMRATAHRPPADFLFGWDIGGGIWVHLTHPYFVNRLKELLHQAGYDPKAFAGHSFRRGGATCAFSQAHLSPAHIKALGDWVSDTFLAYCEVQLELRLQGATAMAAATVDAIRRAPARPPPTLRT